MERADHAVFQRPVLEDGFELFAFESDFVASLRCIPMAVRFKLDLCGIKLSLRQWSRFTLEDRSNLLAWPCASPGQTGAYRDRLTSLIARRAREMAKDIAVEAAPPWTQARTPAVVRDHALSVGLAPPTPRQWAALTALRRFALLKLTREGHDNVNFAPAMREFGLAA